MSAPPSETAAALAGSPPLAGERVAFTGTLASMTHRQARQLAEEAGGGVTEHASRQTTMLVVGEEGWPLDDDGAPARDFQRVVQWRTEGLDIRVLSEADWLHLLGFDERRDEVRRLYTPAMLAELLELPLAVIRRWERIGLIRAERRVFRLPYFDFREVSTARRLSELLAAGVSRQRLEESLARLSGVLSGVDRSLAQLEILSRGGRVLYRRGEKLLEPASGQLFFDFAPPDVNGDSDGDPLDGDDESPASIAFTGNDAATDRLRWTADDWFREGCRLLEEGEAVTAVEAFRLFLMDRPGDAEGNFHLAEALYRLDKPAGAVERYYAAVEADHHYLEAWTQLGCVHEELGELESAADAFGIALEVHPDYPDAHFHRAEVLFRMGRRDDAVPHWQAYLRHDRRGPWAERARQRLAEPDRPNA
ncbi:MAG: tetratricopeptide repeat protein [Planctomycetaceae bacterium]